MHKNGYDPLVHDIKRGRLITINCDRKCPSRKYCSRIPFEIVGNGNIDIIFLSGPPSYTERETNRPFSSRSGTTLRNIVCQLKKRYSKNITYALLHVSLNVPDEDTNRTLIDSEIEHCSHNIKNIIYTYSPKTIVLLGSSAILSIFQEKILIDKVRGMMQEIKISDKIFPVIATYNVNYGINNPDQLGDIYDDISILFGRKKPVIDIEYGPDKAIDYKIITSVKETETVFRSLAQSKQPLIYDIESTNLTKFHSDILTLQFYNGGKTGFCLPWMHPDTPFSNNELEKLKILLKKLFNSKNNYPYVVGHNLKYDFTVTKTILKVDINKPLFDTIIGAYLLDETHAKDDDDSDTIGKKGGYALGSQLLFYGLDDDWYYDAKNRRSDLVNESLDFVARYGVGDVVYNYELLRCQFEEAKHQNYVKQWKNLVLNFYNDQVRLFSDLEINGIFVDTEYLGVLMSPEKSPLIKFIKDTTEKLYNLPSVKEANRRLNKNQPSVFGDIWVFDINKPEHKILLFYDVMKLKPLSYSKKTGKPNVDKVFKKYYMKESEEVKLFFYLGRANQLFNLYPKSFHNILSNNPDCSDGRIRPNFIGYSTRSGRSVVRNPNTQQTVSDVSSDDPINKELTDIVRGLFSSEIGNAIVKLDLMANEVRCWSHLSLDDVLKDAIMQGYNLRKEYFLTGPDSEFYKKLKTEGDIHRSMASKFTQLDIYDITEEMRKNSKGTTFGTMFGLTTFNLAKQLKKTEEETEEIKNSFFKAFKKGKKWLDASMQYARENYYVESPFGRRRRLHYFLIKPPLSTNTHYLFNNRDKIVRSKIGQGERRARNSPIQGLGSDIAFIASFIVAKYIRKMNKNWKLLNVVHDSLEAEVPVIEIKDYIMVSKIAFDRVAQSYIKHIFNETLTVPIEVDYEIGFTFREMIKWDGAYNSLEKIQNKMIEKTKHRKKFDINDVKLMTA